MIARASFLIRRHFGRLEHRPKWPYFWRMWLETTFFAYLVANILQTLFRSPPRTDLNGKTPLVLILSAVLIGPLFETLVFQCLLLETAQTFQLPRVYRFLVSVLPFAAAHYFAGIPTVVAAGLIAGFFFAYTYDRWKRESLFAAIVMTFILHASFNLVGVVGMLLLGK